jgi:uncharacterized protein (TIGR02001 family)
VLPLLRGAIALWALLWAGAAGAQVSARVALVSDYRFRGVSLSDGKPAAQLSVAYDRTDGWYAGGFASTTRLEPESDTHLQLLPYAGYAHRMRSGVSWDAGVEYATFIDDHHYDYPEFHVGVTGQHLGGRIYYSTGYFGTGSSVFYAEIDGAYPLSRSVRLLGHVGWLRGSRDESDGLDPHRFDARAGIALSIAGFDLQLDWTYTDPKTRYAQCNTHCRDRDWLLSLARSW